MRYIKDNFTTGLNNTNWEPFWAATDPNEAWDIMVTQICFLLDITCPIKTFNCKKKKEPWVDNDILQIITEKNSAVSKAKRTLNEDHIRIADFLKKRSRHLCRLANKEFHLREFEANKKKTKAYWASINKLINPKVNDHHFCLIDQNSKLAIPSETTADYINTYFATIGDNLAAHMNAPWHPRGDRVVNRQLNLRPPTMEELIPLLKHININKSSGIEHISTKVLKDTLLAIPGHFNHIISCIINTSLFPDSWKAALVSPLPKGGDTTDVNNLRPISTLPLPAKLVEKVIHKQTIDYLNNNDLLSDNQDGFRPARSTMDSLEKFTNAVYTNLNGNLCTTATFLDFKKAFDTLNHKILFQKLKHLGFSQKSIKLFENYLTNRTQRTKANNHISTPHDINCGVPQGSVRGPLLFLTYINDFGNCLQTLKVQHYADDTVIHIAHHPGDRDTSNLINADLELVRQWCISNKLSLNAKKTKAVTFTTRALQKRLIHPKLVIGNDKIENAPSYKYLGITLDNRLDLKKQVGITKRNVEHKLYMLRKIRKNFPEDTSLTVVKTMLLPILDYGELVYGVAPKTTLDNLQPLVNSALRTVYWNQNTRNHLKLHKLADLNLLHHRRESHLIAHSFKASLVPAKIDNRIIRTRRHDGRLMKVPRVKNPVFRKSLDFRTATIWNQQDIITRKTLHTTEFTAWLKKEYDKKITALPDV